MAGGDELLPVGQKGNYKKYIETATSSVIAEQVAGWLQASTASIGILGASTAQIGHVVADVSTAQVGHIVADVSTAQIGHILADVSTASIGHIIADLSTAKIGALQASTESIGYITALVSTASIGHIIADLSTAKIGALQGSTESIGYVIADLSTAKIGALQASTESIGYVTALVSTASIGHIIADLSTAKIGALQASTESIGYITALVSTASIGHVIADLSTAKIGALQASTESIGYITALVSTASIGHVILDLSTANIGALQASTESIGVVTLGASTASISNIGIATINTVAPAINSQTGLSVGLAAEGYAQADGASNSHSSPAQHGTGALKFATYPYRYNESTWDRVRNNHNVSLLASTSRSSDANSADQTNYNASAHILYLAYDTATGAALTPSLQLKDGVSARYATVWTAAAAVATTTGLYTYCFDPAGSTGSTGFTEVWRGRPGRTWRLAVAHSSSGATQYSASVDNLVAG